MVLDRGERRRAIGQLDERTRATGVGEREIWALLHAGVAPATLVPGIELLAEMPLTTRTVEQGHALSSVLVKEHKSYISDTVTARATVATVAQLLGDPGDSKLSRRISRVRNKLAQLRRKDPRKCTGRHVFLGRTLKRARAKASASEFASSVGPGFVKRHGQVWRNAPIEQKAMYEQLAETHKEQSLVRNKAAIDRQALVLENLAAEQAHDRQSKSLRMSACRWSEAQRVDFDSMFADGDWSASNVDKMRAAIATPARPPDTMQMAVLQSMGGFGEASSDEEAPPWLAWVCEHRDFFRKCMLRVRRAEDDLATFFKFVFAMQNPLLVCVMSAEPGSMPERSLSPQCLFASEPTEWEHMF